MYYINETTFNETCLEQNPCIYLVKRFRHLTREGVQGLDLVDMPATSISVIVASDRPFKLNSRTWMARRLYFVFANGRARMECCGVLFE